VYAITALYEFNDLIIQHKSYDKVKRLQNITKRSIDEFFVNHSLYVRLFFVRPLYCQSSDLQLLITPLYLQMFLFIIIAS
jgi:hypothetical protein